MTIILIVTITIITQYIISYMTIGSYKKKMRSRRYNNKNQILDAIDEFHKAAKFCTSEKPPRVQKRNDYESSNNRK